MSGSFECFGTREARIAHVDQATLIGDLLNCPSDLHEHYYYYFYTELAIIAMQSLHYYYYPYSDLAD
jgi:hypothetical protein